MFTTLVTPDKKIKRMASFYNISTAAIIPVMVRHN